MPRPTQRSGPMLPMALFFTLLRGRKKVPVRSPLVVALLVGVSLGFMARPHWDQLHAPPEAVRPPGTISWNVRFSPRGGCTDLIVQEVRAARRQIRVLAYSFTSKPIADALIQAHQRGVDVAVILDGSHEKDIEKGDAYSRAADLARAGVPTLIDRAHAIQHNKVMVIDAETVMTGSFNFTRQAEERNGENLLAIRDPELAARYLVDWSHHRGHSQPFSSR